MCVCVRERYTCKHTETDGWKTGIKERSNSTTKVRFIAHLSVNVFLDECWLGAFQIIVAIRRNVRFQPSSVTNQCFYHSFRRLEKHRADSNNFYAFVCFYWQLNFLVLGCRPNKLEISNTGRCHHLNAEIWLEPRGEAWFLNWCAVRESNTCHHPMLGTINFTE